MTIPFKHFIVLLVTIASLGSLIVLDSLFQFFAESIYAKAIGIPLGMLAVFHVGALVANSIILGVILKKLRYKALLPLIVGTILFLVVISLMNLESFLGPLIFFEFLHPKILLRLFALPFPLVYFAVYVGCYFGSYYIWNRR